MSILERVKIRLADEDVSEPLLDEFILTAKDRITLRVGADEYPEKLDSITVDVAVKVYRRQYHEGISSENVDGTVTSSFIDDILDEYSAEFNSYRAKNDSKTEVKFI